MLSASIREVNFQEIATHICEDILFVDQYGFNNIGGNND